MATAKERGLILATANEKHFRMFEEIEKEYIEEEIHKVTGIKKHRK